MDRTDIDLNLTADFINLYINLYHYVITEILFETGFLNSLEVGTYKALLNIHYYLFREIYEFAGKVRDVNIAKGNSRFAPVIYPAVTLQHIEKKLNPLLMKLKNADAHPF